MAVSDIADLAKITRIARGHVLLAKYAKISQSAMSLTSIVCHLDLTCNFDTFDSSRLFRTSDELRAPRGLSRSIQLEKLYGSCNISVTLELKGWILILNDVPLE